MKRSTLVFAALSIASMTGCAVGGNDSGGTATADQEQASPSVTMGESDGNPPPLSWKESFFFAEARSARTLEITAPDPPTHTWEVRVDQPSSAALAVRIRTWYGSGFHVFDSTAGSESSACEARGRRSVCVARFPALEAQRAGKWTVVVEKLSKPPAKVSIEIEFTPLPE